VIILLPNRYEIRTLHALHDRGFTISTLRFPSGMQRNVAIDVERQQRTVINLWQRMAGKKL
jgi:hypothetical protein